MASNRLFEPKPTSAVKETVTALGLALAALDKAEREVSKLIDAIRYRIYRIENVRGTHDYPASEAISDIKRKLETLSHYHHVLQLNNEDKTLANHVKKAKKICAQKEIVRNFNDYPYLLPQELTTLSGLVDNIAISFNSDINHKKIEEINKQAASKITKPAKAPTPSN